LLLQQGFNYEQAIELDLLVAKLVIGLVVRVSFQLESLFTGIIFEPGTSKTIYVG